MNNIIYQRDGVVIIFDETGITVKKNGLTIHVPSWMIDDLVQEFELEQARLVMGQLRGEG